MQANRSERILIERMQKGDSRAFAEFVDTHGDALHRLARRYAVSEADAEDLTQDIFVSLSRSIGSFRGESRLSTWAYRVALNHCLRHVERRRPDNVPLDEVPVAGTGGDPTATIERQELTHTVHAALDTLGEGHREVVILHELHGLTYAECAQALGIPVGTVKSRLSNAFTRLRDRLGSYVRGEEGEHGTMPAGSGGQSGTTAALVGIAGTIGETRR